MPLHVPEDLAQVFPNAVHHPLDEAAAWTRARVAVGGAAACGARGGEQTGGLGAVVVGCAGRADPGAGGERGRGFRVVCMGAGGGAAVGIAMVGMRVGVGVAVAR